MDSEGWLQPQTPAPSRLPPSLPSPSPRPEKIFSEVTPKCEKCHSVVKPGEPQGQGPTQMDLGWDPPDPSTSPFPGRPPSLPDSAPDLSPLHHGSHPSPRVCLLLLPGLSLCDPASASRFTFSFCLCVCLSICLRHRVLR